VDNAIEARHISVGAIDATEMLVDGIITEAKLAGAVQSKLNAAIPYVRASRAPSQTDDSANTAGATYLEGTGAALRAKWVDDTDPQNPQIWECIDPTVGNAVWVDVTNIEADDLSDLAFIDKTTLESTINITSSRVSNFNAAVEAAVQANDNTFTGTNTFQNALTLQGGLNATSATFTGIVNGTSINLSGGIDVTGNISAGGSITGGAISGSSLAISGLTTFNGNVTANSDITLAGTDRVLNVGGLGNESGTVRANNYRSNGEAVIDFHDWVRMKSSLEVQGGLSTSENQGISFWSAPGQFVGKLKSVLQGSDFTQSGTDGSIGDYNVFTGEANREKGISMEYLFTALNETSPYSVRGDLELKQQEFSVSAENATRLDMPFWSANAKYLFFRNGLLVAPSSFTAQDLDAINNSAYVEFTDKPLANGEVVTAIVHYQHFGGYEVGGA
jgi:cytoskeletal protein CcmA (bactofilin family)